MKRRTFLASVSAAFAGLFAAGKVPGENPPPTYARPKAPPAPPRPTESLAVNSPGTFRFARGTHIRKVEVYSGYVVHLESEQTTIGELIVHTGAKCTMSPGVTITTATMYHLGRNPYP